MMYLALNLKGFMQHYSAKNYLVTAPSSVYYKTEKVPTKSAVIGMIGAAFGIARESETLDKFYNNLDIKYKILNKGSVTVDFQTVRPLHKGERFINVKGEKRPDKDAIIKRIEYLQDYEFIVYIGGERTILNQILVAFDHPIYPPYLGKRSCIPSKAFITDRNFISLEEIDNVHDCP